MNEPSTSMYVPRSAVPKSEEKEAVLKLGLPYLKPYKDIDNGPFTRDSRGS